MTNPASQERSHKGANVSVSLCTDTTCWCWPEDRAKREQAATPGATLTGEPSVYTDGSRPRELLSDRTAEVHEFGHPDAPIISNQKTLSQLLRADAEAGRSPILGHLHVENRRQIEAADALDAKDREILQLRAAAKLANECLIRGDWRPGTTITQRADAAIRAALSNESTSQDGQPKTEASVEVGLAAAAGAPSSRQSSPNRYIEVALQRAEHMRLTQPLTHYPTVAEEDREVLASEIKRLRRDLSELNAASQAAIDAAMKGIERLRATLSAWESRFPQYRYRPQDECVALSGNSPSTPNRGEHSRGYCTHTPSCADLAACRPWLVARKDSLALSGDMIRMVDELLERRRTDGDRIERLEHALRGLYWDQVDYLTRNNLGGMNNHWMQWARFALGIQPEDQSPETSPDDRQWRWFAHYYGSILQRIANGSEGAKELAAMAIAREWSPSDTGAELIAHMLPFLQQFVCADFAELDARNALISRVEKHLAGLPQQTRKTKKDDQTPGNSSVILNGYQLKAALEFSAPDLAADELETEVSIQWGDAGHSGAGYYACITDYPEEGSILLSDKADESPEEPAAPHPLPANGGPIRITDHAEGLHLASVDAARTRQSGSPGGDPSGECQENGSVESR